MLENIHLKDLYTMEILSLACALVKAIDDYDAVKSRLTERPTPITDARTSALTVAHLAAMEFLEDDGGITKFLENAYGMVDNHVKVFIERKFTHLQVCFGCTGGQHRSVYCAEHLAQHLADRFDIKITVCHRELDIEKIL
jgi:RNase adaptor protein for sRNA GlmZ degradation